MSNVTEIQQKLLCEILRKIGSVSIDAVEKRIERHRHFFLLLCRRAYNDKLLAVDGKAILIRNMLNALTFIFPITIMYFNQII